MPIVIAGYLTIDTATLRDHLGHDLRAKRTRVPAGVERLMLRCVQCDATLVEEPEPRNDLPCGCRDKADHDDSVRIIDKMRKDFHIPKTSCVGCVVGDDGPSIHECVIHDRRYWA